MTLIDLSGVFLMGLAGAGHCVGMCGGFVLALGARAEGMWDLTRRHLAYHAGKTTTYVFLAILLTAGLGIVGRAGWLTSGQQVLAVAAGVIMVLYGLSQALEIRTGASWKRWLEGIPLCRSIGSVVRSKGIVGAYATGWLNGFLPCGFLLAALFFLASRQSVLFAASGAVVFGAATIPGLFLFGLAAGGWSVTARRRLVRLTGLLLIMFGALTLVRAFPEGRHWLHDQLIPATWGAFRDWCGF